MNRLSVFTGWALKKLWMTLAVLLVLFAVLLSAIRYALPQLDEHTQQLEEYVLEHYGLELTIGELKADWQKAGPSLVLDNVTLNQNDASPLALHIDNIDIELDFWRSLAQRQLSSNRFNLSGFNLVLDTTRLQGGEGDNDFPVVKALKNLFLEQLEQFALNRGSITLIGGDKPEVIELSSLNWLNRDGHHQGEGTFQVREVASNSASFIIDLHGGQDDLSGVVYARAEELDISPWISSKINTRRPLQESRANLEAWAEVKNSQFSAFFSRIHDSQLTWGGDDSVSVSTGIKGGSIQALPKNGHWFFRVDELVFESNKQSLVTDVVGRLSPSGDVLVNTMKPAPVNPFLVLLPLFSDDAADDDVRELNPTGELATLQLSIRNKGIALSAKLLDVGWQQRGILPGVDALDVDINWFKNQGAITVQANNGKLASSNLLGQDVALNQLNADIYVHQEQVGDNPGHWLVSYQDLLLDTNLMSLSQSLRLDVTGGSMSLMTAIDDLPVSSATQLFPASLMGQNTTDYLKRALASGKGQVEHGRVLWQGAFSDFPFNDNSGIFQAYLNLTDTTFAFSKDWPALTRTDIALHFENAGLAMAAPAATLAGITVTDLRADIARLAADASLVIDANGAGTGEQLADLMMDSSLSESLGKVLKNEVQVQGDVRASLHLDIPLNSPDVVASGNATLTGNHIFIDSIGLPLSAVKGNIRFRNENISSTDLSADMLGQPVGIELTGAKGNQGYEVNIGVGGNWDVAPLISRLNPDMTRYLTGLTDWQANVSLALPEQGFHYTASVISDLQGVSSSLPSPLNKKSPQTKRLSVTSQGDQTASTITAMLGKNTTFNGVLPHREMQFSRAHLALGESEQTSLGTGFSIAANLPALNLTDWYKAIELLISGVKDNGSDKPGLFAVPRRIFINTDNLVVGGQALSKVDIVAKQLNNNWLLDINSDQARARVNLYDEWLSRGIEIEADYINFAQLDAPDDAVQHDWDPATLPPVYFHCRQCSVLGKKLGEVTVDVVKSPQGMEIRQLAATGEHHQFSGKGRWQANSNITAISGSLKSDDAGQMLTNWGVDSGIKDSSANIDFEVSWPKAPMDFSAQDLQGKLSWQLSDGYLSEVSDKGSRIFTLFSLNSLVRKLSLDFRDVFAQGFFYDDMSGTLEIADGKASTQDTVIDGGAGEITIKGYTDLIARQLNYRVSFTPNVTGNLPVLVYFLATPQTALAALALDQVLTSAKVISNVNYQVTGTWSEPQFDEVGRDSKDIPLPAQKQAIPDKEQILTQPDLERLNLEVQDG
ncbi:YhdP family protein [Salinimonas lutimaris]|uniref:YhdP family protein n=1 Tax=Salinimonas lutimaris TaxID=914153 RepID=UPI0010C1146D|nr:YhdP family protein [Salinimonas lutimaris]